jgi:hypothetical protein
MEFSPSLAPSWFVPIELLLAFIKGWLQQKKESNYSFVPILEPFLTLREAWL